MRMPAKSSPEDIYETRQTGDFSRLHTTVGLIRFATGPDKSKKISAVPNDGFTNEEQKISTSKSTPFQSTPAANHGHRAHQQVHTLATSSGDG